MALGDIKKQSGFSGAIDAFVNNKRSPERRIAERIATIASTNGATTLELECLLALAAVESAFDPDAVGDGGKSHGLFQIEKDAIDFESQVLRAHKQCRSFLEEQASKDPLIERIVSQDKNDLIRILRAQWQRGAKADGAVKRWYAHLVKQAGNIGHSGKSGQALADYRAELMLSWRKGEKYGVDAFIDWSADEEGSNRDALEKGQRALERFMTATRWSPLSYVDPRAGSQTGAARPSSDKTFGDRVADAWGDTLDVPGNFLASAVRWGFDTLWQGGKEVVRQVLTKVVPATLLVGGGVLGYRALKKAWKVKA